MPEDASKEIKPVRPSIKLDSAQLQRLQDMPSDVWSEDENEDKNMCSCSFVHNLRRIYVELVLIAPGRI
ncbi:hypothetical protein M3Y97_00297500 [Aphelenchoides bicaudatus]|nr:hypothetical protein M3Y97_00297500 [Aphelenchoides bicaudatus]